MPRKQPILYFTYANDPKDPARYLDTLNQEYQEVDQLLKSKEARFGYRTMSRVHTTLGSLFSDLQTYHNQITLFHFGGHAGEDHLLLQHLDGAMNAAKQTGLSILFGAEENLKLMFLNGCATKGHVTSLLAKGIPAIIATSAPVGDQQAANFSHKFYESLTAGKTILEAFEAAKGAIIAGSTAVPTFVGDNFIDNFIDHRSIGWKGGEMEDAVPWGIYVHAEKKEVLHLTLDDLGIDIQIDTWDGEVVEEGQLRDLPEEGVFPIIVMSAEKDAIENPASDLAADRNHSSIEKWKPFGDTEDVNILDLLREYQQESGYPIRVVFLYPRKLTPDAKARLDQVRRQLTFIVDCLALQAFHAQESTWLDKLNSANVGGCIVPICKTYSSGFRAFMHHQRETYLDSLGFFFKDYKKFYVHIELEVQDKWTLFRRLNTIAYLRMRLEVPKRVNKGSNSDLPNLSNIPFEL